MHMDTYGYTRDCTPGLTSIDYIITSIMIIIIVISDSCSFYKITFAVSDPVGTGRKLSLHKTFRRRPGRLLNVLCTFNLRPVSTGKEIRQKKIIQSNFFLHWAFGTYS